MKFMHLSDLHLGKRVHEFSMVEDQKYILSQILSVLDGEGADGVFLAGDIYDKPVPSVEAVQLFDSFLTRLAERKLPVFIISGNHDSTERISFGAKLMESRNVYISPVYEGKVRQVILEDSYGEVCITLLPFLKSVKNYEDAIKEVVEHLMEDRRNVLLTHQFVTGASRCESEEIMVGGLDQIDVSLFDPFDYVALGHLHSPQKVGRETVRYCGTPLKYSFSEAEQEKSVTFVELKEKGETEIRTVMLRPLRDMRKIRGTYLEVTAKDFYEGTNREDYLQVTLTDEEDIPDGMQKLRIIYPNLMRLEYDNQRTRESRLVEAVNEVEKKSEQELFEDFFEIQNNQPMSELQRNFVKKLLEDMKQ